MSLKTHNTTTKTISKSEDTKVFKQSKGPQAVAEVFSIARDIDAANPYHFDGDIQMYSEENLQIRANLRKDPQIDTRIQQIVKLYPLDADQHITEKTYKQYQTHLALILRSDIEKDELKFIVDKDWELDSQQFEGKYLTKDKLADALFQMVDVWTIGNQKQQYASFCRLLHKKLSRAIKS